MFFNLCVLILEGRAADAELLVHELRAAGVELTWRRVDNEADYLASLDPPPDIILADYHLPNFDALLALRLLQARGLDIPFIVVTGTSNEEAAVECMKLGAADYLIKDRLHRLGQAVAQALSAKKLRDEKRQAIDDLRRSEERYRVLLESATDAISVYGVDGRYITANNSFAASFGLRPADIIGRTPEELFPADLAARICQSNLFAMKTGAFIDRWIEHDTPRGPRTFQIHGVAMRDETGEIIGVLSVARDITEQKVSRELLRLAVDEARKHRAEAIALLKSARAVLETLHFEEAAQRILAECRLAVGARAGFIALLNDADQMDLVLAQDLGALSQYTTPLLTRILCGPCAEARATGQVHFDNHLASCECAGLATLSDPGVWNIISAPISIQGSVVGLFVIGNKATPFTGDDARLVAGFAEITAIAFQNSRILRTLENSEQRFRSVAETASDAIVVVDTSSKEIILWNQAAETIFGYSASEAVGQDFDMIVPARFRERHHAAFERALTARRLSQQGQHLEGAGLRKDGTEVPIEASNSLWQVGEETFVTVVMRDITERKLIQQERERAQRLETAGLIASEVAHDLNNMLSPLAGYPELIKMRLPDGHPAARFCDEIIKSSRQIESITENLLALGRRGQFDPRPVCLNEVVRAAAAQVAPRAGSSAIDLQLIDSLPMVNGSEAQLIRVVANLLANAQDAVQEDVDGSGSIRVTTDEVYLDKPFERPGRYEARRYVRVTVADDGRGIPPDVLGKIYDPFFSTKRMNGRYGTGLGLTIVRQIVDDHQGSLEVQSTPGTGTVFTVYLPALQE